MSKLVIASLVTLSLAALAAPSLASHNVCSDPATIEVGGVYVDIRHVADDTSLWSIWIFAESGVQAGLQRGGTQAALAATGNGDLANDLGEIDRDCVASPASDHLIL